MIIIFHTADLHLGMQFTRGFAKDLKEALKQERFDCLKRMIQMANDEKCDLFVVAGDMFQTIKLPLKEIKETANILNTFEGTSVVILPGNHDFYNQDSKEFWKSLKEKIKNNLLVFLDKEEVVELSIGEKKINIFPGPCVSQHSEDNMIEWIKDENIESKSINIGISHGSVEGLSPDMEKKYFPKTLRELDECNLDLWLLGHTHIRYPREEEAGKSIYFMPATPAPDGFDCFHKGSAWLIEVDEDKSINAKSVMTGKYYFKTIVRTVNSFNDLNALKSDIYREDKNLCLLKLTVEGYLDDEDLKKMPVVEDEIRKLVRYLEFENNIKLKITKDFISTNYQQDSFPFNLLNNLIGSGNRMAPQMAYDLLKEVKNDT
jgi:DNA repair exonuclease SbcCD nuclease subunit